MSNTNGITDQQFVREGAAFSQSTYGNVVALPPGNWTVLDRKQISTDSGYQATVYVDRDAKRVFYANTGTNDLKDVAAWKDAVFGPQ